MTLKKVGIFLTTLAMVVTGCVAPVAPTGTGGAAGSGDAAASGEKVTIEFWTVDSEEYNEDVQRRMVEQFEAEHPNIDVNMTVLPSGGFDEKMTTTLGAGEGAPDVAFFWINSWLPEALELSELIANDPDFDPAMYYPGFWDTRAKWGDSIIGLPLGVGANFVMYNKDILDAAGVAYPTADWTADEYIAMTQELSDDATRRWGGDRPRGPFRAIWRNYGAYPYSDDSTTVEGYLNSDASVAAYTWLWDLVNAGTTPTPSDLEVLSSEGTGPVELFMAGRLAMATLNQGHMLNATDAGMNFGIVAEPSAGTDGDRFVNAWANTIGVWKGTEHPQEAWEFLSYWGGKKGQEFLMLEGNLFPSIPELFDAHPDADAEYVQQFKEVLDLNQVQTWNNAHPCSAEILRSASNVWDLIMLGEIGRDEVKATLDAAVAPAQTVLDDCVTRLGG